MLGITNGRVEAAGPVRGGDRVPQRDARPPQFGKALFVSESRQFPPDSTPDEMPEQVARVSVIALLGEGDFPRQAPKDEDPGIGSGDRGEG